ncbi:MAG: cation transporter, partial [Anaerolineae bacterium]
MSRVKDPVCGMEIEQQDAVAVRAYDGRDYYFCSADCEAQFVQNPEHYVAPRVEAIPSVTTGVPEKVEGPVRSEIPIVGLDCATCVVTIEKSLRAVPGVQQATVNFANETAFVTYDPGVADLENLTGAIKSAGYRVGGAKTRIGIQDLRCASCVTFIEEALKGTPGVLEASVNVGTQEAYIEYLPAVTSLADLRAAVESVGYQTRPAPSEEPADKEAEEREKEYRSLFNKFLFAAIVSVPVVATAYPQFVPLLRDLPMGTLRLIWGVMGLLTLPVLLWSGSGFFRGAWSAFRHRAANMNTLIALGTAAAWLYSGVTVLAPGIFPEGTAEPFYDVAAVVIALVVLGQALELRAKGRTSEAIKKLMGLQ